MELAFDRRGAGPPLLLIHPLGADRRVWEPVLDALARERDVVALDLPGFGDSPPISNGTEPTPSVLADAVGGLADELGIERPHVAGCSLGAWVGFELALRGDARSATGIGPAGLWPAPLRPKPGIARALARAALPVLSLLVRSPRWRGLALGGTVAHPERVPPSAARHLVRAYATAPGLPAVNAAMRARRFADLEQIRVPVTLAWGERDRLVSRPAHLPPSVAAVTLRGCGHVPMWDDPEQVAALLLRGSGG